MVKINTTEREISDILLEGHNSGPQPYTRFYKNHEYGKKSRTLGELDLVIEYDTHIVLYEIKSNYTSRNHAQSQLERAIRRCELLNQNKPIFGILAFYDEEKNMKLEYLVGGNPNGSIQLY